MIKRCIMIFPEFENTNIIDCIRKKYDPLAKHVKPHITLVFPFESEISKEDLENHINTSLKGTRCFALTSQGIVSSKVGGNYLFLKVTNGFNEIREIHDRLYTSILSNYFVKEISYIPHMTIGKLSDEASLSEAYEFAKNITDRFDTIVKKISVEVIEKSQDSIIEFEYGLQN